MTSRRFVSVLGLGFGDCGKGLFTDYLVRRLGAHTVVRFNGGAQAGHNVVLVDGRQHTFSQLGAGTFVPRVATLLASPVVVHPSALLIENDYLQRVGVQDALSRLVIDARCRINTPFHQAAGRLRELVRGTQAHGSCGIGFGATVEHALEHPDEALLYGDLMHPARTLEKLEAIRRRLEAEFRGLRLTEGSAEELAFLASPKLAGRWLQGLAALTRQVPPSSREAVGERLGGPGAVVFEGAQGVLLDEWHGFHPHTTWSSTHGRAAERVVADVDASTPIQHFGVIRSYLTRHGRGPLPTHDIALDSLTEPHNASDGWQSVFRRGHPDAVLLRYAREAVGSLDALLVTHLDAFERGATLRWCRGYGTDGQHNDDSLCVRTGANNKVVALRLKTRDLAHQTRLTALLERATPIYDTAPIASGAAFVADVEQLTRSPVAAGSYGNRADAVTVFQSGLI